MAYEMHGIFLRPITFLAKARCFGFNSRKNQTFQKTNVCYNSLIDIIVQSVQSFIDLQTTNWKRKLNSLSNR